MKKKFAVAMAITAGLCFAGGGQLKPAFAGYWEEVPNPYEAWSYPPDPNEPNYIAWKNENALRYSGTSSIYGENWAGIYTLNTNWQDDLEYTGFYVGNLEASSSPGYTQSVASKGKMRIKFHWFRDQVNGHDDPKDNPPAMLNIIAYLSALASQGVGDVSNVVVETTVGVENGSSFMGEDFPGYDDSYYTSMIWDKAILVPIPTSTIDANGDLWSPWFTYDGKAQADIGPSVNYDCRADLLYGFDWDFDNRAATSQAALSQHITKGRMACQKLIRVIKMAQ